jgi:hypothetical protein
MSKLLLKKGDKVTCKIAVPVYYGEGYHGTPKIMFEPNNYATVYNPTCPKVRLQAVDETHDRRDVFVVADCIINGKTERVGLNYCNVVKL